MKLDKKVFSIYLLRCIPIITSVLGFALCAGLAVSDIFGFDYARIVKIIFHLVVVLSGFMLVHSLSNALGFCTVHRLGIFYTLSVLACIYYERYCGFSNLRAAHILMAAIGLIYVVFVFIKAHPIQNLMAVFDCKSKK